MSRKIKITAEQAKMLQEINTSKVIKITEAQFKLIESELNTIPKSKRPSLKVAKAFKQSGVTKEEDNLLGHPIGGTGGKEYNPQTVKQNKETTKSFNEGEINEISFAEILDYKEFAGHALEYIKSVFNNTSQEGLSTFWVKNGFTHGELNRILGVAGVAVAGVIGGEKVLRLSKKLPKIKMIKKGISALFAKYKEKKEEEVKNVMKKRVPTVHGANKPKDPNDPRYSKVAEAGKKPKPKQLPNPELGEPKTRRSMQPRPKQLDNPEVSEDGGYPMGAANDSRAPYNQTDASRMTPTTPKTSVLEELYSNSEMSILVGKDGKKYLFTFDHIPKEDFAEYSEIEYTTSKGEDGDVDYEFDYDTLDIDGEVIERYVNDNIKEIPKGKGIEGLDDGMDLNLIDNALANKILSIWNTDDNLKKVLGIQETTSAGASSGAFVAPLGTDVIKGKIKESAPKISMFSDEEGIEMKTMDDVTEEEEIDEEVEEIEEVTTTASVGGSYVTPMMWAKDKDSHKPSKKTMYPNGKFVGESTNQTDTAYPEGKFVEFDDCTKLNNNKEAENGGCSTGAIDGVAKEKGTKNSVVSKEALYYEIAKKTGKTEKEVESIIEGYLLNKDN